MLHLLYNTGANHIKSSGALERTRYPFSTDVKGIDTMSDHTSRPQQLQLPLVKLCECGCGRPAPIATYTNQHKGYFKGQPVRFCVGHAGRRPLAVRFWKYARKDEPDKCWIWQGTCSPAGYGRISDRYAIYAAHRASWEIHNGPIPDGLFVLHKCDNPVCVNPDHLFLGTHQDNMDDMKAKGRGSQPPVHLGNSNPNGKLTAEDVLAIRARVANGDRKTDIAKHFGIGVGHVYDIIKRVVWKHI